MGELRRRGDMRRYVIGLMTGVVLVATVSATSGASLTKSDVKKIVTKMAKKQINALVPRMIDDATIDRGALPVVTASTSDPNKPIFTKGPFTVSLDCSLSAGDVNLKLLVGTTEENSVVDDGSLYIVGDLDPGDGNVTFQDYTGNPPGGDAVADYPYYEAAFLLSPSGTRVFIELDTITNFKGNDCFVDAWFLDLTEGGTTARATGAMAKLRAPTAGPISGGDVKKAAKKVATKRVKALAPELIDDATIDQEVLGPVAAATTDPNKPIFNKGPFTVSLDCSLSAGDVNLKLLIETTEENSVVNGAGPYAGDLDPSDGEQTFFMETGSPPGDDASSRGVYDEQAAFQSPSGSNVYVQFSLVTNFAGNQCFVTGWRFDLDEGGAARVVPRTARARAAPLSIGDVKKTAKKVVTKRIKSLVPGLIDDATFEQGVIAPVTASTTDSNKPVFARGPLTITLDCSLSGGGDVNMRLLVRTAEENTVVGSGGGYINGDLDPIDGDTEFTDDTGNPPGGEPNVGDQVGYQYAVFRTPSGTHLFGQFDAITNFKGNHCYVDGFFLDLAT